MNKNVLFSEEVVNRGRQVELDFVKGIAIITMIICHTTDFMGKIPDHAGYVFAESVLGGPIAAPMFMICMGIGLSFSRHRTPLEIIKRGASLFILAYILNFARVSLPMAAGFLMGMGDVVSENAVLGFMNVDILQFAGLALIFIGICKKLELRDWQMIAFAVLCSIVGGFCNGFTSGSLAVDSIVGLFIGAGPMNHEDCVTAFPFANWIIFPVLGLIAGRYLSRCTDKERLYRRVLAASLPLTLLYGYIVYRNGLFPFSHGFYYWTTFADSFFFICLDLTFVSLGWQLCKVLPKWIMQPLEGLSRHITSVYFISWIIICWVGLLLFMGLELEPLNPWLSYLPALVITAVSYFLALKWDKRREKQTTK